MQTPTITIAGRKIGPGHPAYVIAEMSGNHNQSFEKAARDRAGRQGCRRGRRQAPNLHG